jgi:hypothetical protein
MLDSRTRTAAIAAVLVALAGGVCAPAADEPKPAQQRPQLNPIDPIRLWEAVGPAIRAGRVPELFEQIQSNFSTAPRTSGSPGGWYHPSISRYTWEWFAAQFDGNGDGTIVRAEFTGPVGAWDRLEPDGQAGEPPVRHDRFRWQRPDHQRGMAGVFRRRCRWKGPSHKR